MTASAAAPMSFDTPQLLTEPPLSLSLSGQEIRGRAACEEGSIYASLRAAAIVCAGLRSRSCCSVSVSVPLCVSVGLCAFVCE